MSFLLALLTISFIFWQFLTTPLFPREQAPVEFVFIPGTTVTWIAYELHRRDILSHPLLFIWFAKITSSSKKLHAGEYRLPAGTTGLRLLNMMVKGEVVKHVITLVEGWTFPEIRKALDANVYLEHQLTGLTDADVMKKIGLDGLMPEGRFAPDTYVFSGKMSDALILRNAYELMQKRLAAAWQQRDLSVPYKCSYEALIVASLVEKESAYLPERPLIAGVIIKRWQMKMPLQIDAAVIYGLGTKYIGGGKVSAQDLITDTPYNTYLHFGLPPTPIGLVSESALVAAFHPVISDNLYYVAKGDGTHVFSKTLAEHNAARQRYLLSK